MTRSLRPLLFFAAALTGAHGLVSACSLDLDESLIGAGGDAAQNDDVQSFGGFEAGGNWGDATTDGPASDASDATTEASTDATDGSPVAETVSCGTGASCELGQICCWDSNGSGACEVDAQQCASLVIACDSTSDCAPGQVCCLLNIGGSIACASTCPSTPVGALQFCEGDPECMNSICDTPTALIANLLPPGYKACQ